MKNNKEDYSEKPILQSDSPDSEQSPHAPKALRQTSPGDLARDRRISTELFASVPHAWEKIEPTLLGEESPEELATKRDIFIGLMSGVPHA